jgi:hypothetical protein
MEIEALPGFAATTIRADLLAKGLTPSANMETVLTTLATNSGCWEAIYSVVALWALDAQDNEFASFWLSVLSVCKTDGRSMAAYPVMFALKDDSETLHEMWSALPTDALPQVKDDLASNPLLFDVAGAPPQFWAELLAKMEKLSHYGVPDSPDHAAMRAIIERRAPHFSDIKKDDLVRQALALLQTGRNVGKPKEHGAKRVIARALK